MEVLEIRHAGIDTESLPAEVAAEIEASQCSEVRTNPVLSEYLESIEPAELELETVLPSRPPWKPSLKLQLKLNKAEKAAAEEPINFNDPVGLFLKDAGPLLDAAEEIELAKAIEKGELKAKDILVKCNLRLVHSQAKKFFSKDTPASEHLQNGLIGLIRAAEKFDWRTGYKFSTYAVNWIKHEILREIDNQSRTIRFPVDVAQREKKINRVIEAHIKKTGREPTQEEIAALANIPLKAVVIVQEAPRTTSLDAERDTNDFTLHNVVAAAESHTASAEYIPVDDEVELNLFTEEIAAALDDLVSQGELDIQGRQIVEMHLGLGKYAGILRPKAIGQELGIPTNKVSAIIQSTLCKLTANAAISGYHQAAVA